MRKLLLILLVLAVVLFAVAVYLMKSGIVPWEVSRYYSIFKGSDYFQPLWSTSCTFDLNDTANLVVMAHLRENGKDAELTCWWNRKPIEYRQGAGIVLNDTTVNMDQSWMGCGKDYNFTKNFREAIYNQSEIIYLSDRPPRREQTNYYVLVSKCANGTCSCSCGSGEPTPAASASNVTGVAYALLDVQTNKVYW